MAAAQQRTLVTTRRGIEVEVRSGGTARAPTSSASTAWSAWPRANRCSTRWPNTSPCTPRSGRATAPIENEGADRGHARFRPARLGHRRCPRARRTPTSWAIRSAAMVAGRDGVRCPERPRPPGPASPRFGLWLDDHPIPDPFAVLPFELAEVLLARPGQRRAAAGGRGRHGSRTRGWPTFMVGQRPAPRDRRQDHVPDPEPAALETPLPPDRPDPRGDGGRR